MGVPTTGQAKAFWLLTVLALVCWLPSAKPPVDAQAVISDPTPKPAPATAIPPSETVPGAIGTDVTKYATADHIHPRISRMNVVSTDSSGSWSITWSTVMASTPGVFVIPINSGDMPVTCNVVTRSTTGASGKCWNGQTTLLNLSIVTAGLTVTPDVSVGAGVQVQVIAVPVG